MHSIFTTNKQYIEAKYFLNCPAEAPQFAEGRYKHGHCTTTKATTPFFLSRIAYARTQIKGPN
jgi:hypothetical protein